MPFGTCFLTSQAECKHGAPSEPAPSPFHELIFKFLDISRGYNIDLPRAAEGFSRMTSQSFEQIIRFLYLFAISR